MAGTERGRQISELRRSGAAGLHVSWSKDRANGNRAAIEQEWADEGDDD